MIVGKLRDLAVAQAALEDTPWTEIISPFYYGEGAGIREYGSLAAAWTAVLPLQDKLDTLQHNLGLTDGVVLFLQLRSVIEDGLLLYDIEDSQNSESFSLVACTISPRSKSYQAYPLALEEVPRLFDCLVLKRFDELDEINDEQGGLLFDYSEKAIKRFPLLVNERLVAVFYREARGLAQLRFEVSRIGADADHYNKQYEVLAIANLPSLGKPIAESQAHEDPYGDGACTDSADATAEQDTLPAPRTTPADATAEQATLPAPRTAPIDWDSNPYDYEE